MNVTPARFIDIGDADDDTPSAASAQEASAHAVPLRATPAGNQGGSGGEEDDLAAAFAAAGIEPRDAEVGRAAAGGPAAGASLARVDLPYTFAKRHGLLLEESGGGRAAPRAPSRRLAAGPVRGAPQGRAEVRPGADLERRLRCPTDPPLRGRDRSGDGHHGRLRRRPEPRGPRRGAARARGPAREHRRRAGHPPDQRDADRGGQEAGVGHPHRALRETSRRALPRRRRDAEARRAAAGDRPAGHLAPQGHGETRHRGAPAASGRTHLAARRRTPGGRAGLHAALRPRRARGAAPSRQAGRTARSREPRHAAGRLRVAQEHALALPRHHPRHRPDRLGEDHDPVRRPGAS